MSALASFSRLKSPLAPTLWRSPSRAEPEDSRFLASWPSCVEKCWAELRAASALRDPAVPEVAQAHKSALQRQAKSHDRRARAGGRFMFFLEWGPVCRSIPCAGRGRPRVKRAQDSDLGCPGECPRAP